MDLRELLLQFAGENDRALHLEDTLINSIEGISIDSEIANRVKVVVKNPKDREKIKEDIQKILEKNGYEEYSITPVHEGEICSIIVEI